LSARLFRFRYTQIFKENWFAYRTKMAVNNSIWISSDTIEEENEEEYHAIFECELDSWTLDDINIFTTRCKNHREAFCKVFDGQNVDQEESSQAKAAWFKVQENVNEEYLKLKSDNSVIWNEFEQWIQTKFEKEVDNGFKEFVFGNLFLNSRTRQELGSDSLLLAFVVQGVFPPDLMTLYFHHAEEVPQVIIKGLEGLIIENRESSLSSWLIPMLMACAFESSVFLSREKPKSVIHLVK
jgi:hypothetical protein